MVALAIRAGGQVGSPRDAEPPVVVEVDAQLAQRHRPRPVFAGDLGVAFELDRDVLGAGQLARFETPVGAEDEVFVFDKGAAATGPGRQRQGCYRDRRERPPFQPGTWHGEVSMAGKKSPFSKRSLPFTWSLPPEQYAFR